MVSSSRFQDDDFEGPVRGAGRSAPTGPEAIERLIALLQELAAYSAHYLAARVDATRGRARRMAIAVGLLLGAAAIGMVVLATAAVLLLVGLAQALSLVCGGQAWAGNLLAGGGLLMGCLAVAAWWMWRVNRTALAAANNKYEQRKRDQRERFGRDASGPATAGPAK